MVFYDRIKYVCSGVFYMQLYASDKAIEFNAVYENLQRTIKSLKEINIDVSKEEAEALRIKSECESKAFNSINVADIEQTYQDGIASLNGVFEGLKRHELYYNSYQAAGRISYDLDSNSMFDSECMKAFSGATITLLKQINASDTRSFATEKKVVKEVYDTAYNMIKNELLASGKSRVLDYVRSDDTASGLMASLVEKDIEKLSSDEVIASEIKKILCGNKGDLARANYTELMASLASNNNYLNEELILFLAMHDKQSVERIENSLLRLLSACADMEAQAEDANKSRIIADVNVRDFKQTIKDNRIYKKILLSLALVAMLVSIKVGSKEASKYIGHDEYRTDVDYYSSIGAENPTKYPEYMEKIEGFSKTTLTAYGPWHRDEILYGDYKRAIVTYDLTNVDLDRLEDYTNIDFSKLSRESFDNESAEYLDPSELYAEAIVEITRIVQDESSETFVPNEEAQNILNIVVSSLVALASLTGGFFILRSTIENIKEGIKARRMLKSELVVLKERIEEFERLSRQNKEFKLRFLDCYQKFGDIVQNEKLQDAYGRLRLIDND